MNVSALVRLSPHLIKAVRSIREGKPMAMSFDIADFCTLACPYCYWLTSTQHQQLRLDEVVGITREAVVGGIIHATWIGGEPTLRPDVLMAVTPLVPINWVVTNGMFAKKGLAGKGWEIWDVEDLPKNTWVIISLDGVSEAHDSSRNHPGLYAEIVNRFFDTQRSRRTLTTTTLHRGNVNQPELLLKEWQHSKVLGMTFEFATPIGRRPNPQWDIIGDDRNRAIDRLLALKRRYGNFMRNSEFGLNMQRPENLLAWVGAKNCPTARLSVSFDSLGRLKTPCVLGSNRGNPKGQKPVCTACGCHVPAIFEGVRRGDLETLRAAFWFLT